MTDLLIPLFEDERELKRYLESDVQEDKDGKRGEFARALDLDISHLQRAIITGIDITCVEFRDDIVVVSYDVDYHIYNGCKDLDANDNLEHHVHGNKTDEGWVFKENAPLVRRTTVDEF